MTNQQTGSESITQNVTAINKRYYGMTGLAMKIKRKLFS